MKDLIEKLNSKPNEISFQEIISFIDENFDFTPTKFKNGEIINEAGQNNGSCKLFSFAKLAKLSKQETLNCFGDYYRIDVLKHTEGTDHQNIRNFILFGWEGIDFDQEALKAKIA